jgi:hypothetical protein
MKKFGSVSLGVAIFSTLLLIGTSVFTVQKLVSNAAVADWQQGASIMPKSPDDFASESFKQSVRDLHATGANSVSLIIPYYQNNLTSSNFGPGWNTPNDQALTSAIQYIHSLGMQVMLKPHIDSYTGEWRALINASDRATWFTTYSNMLNHLGDIAQQNNVEVIAVGSELITMATYSSNQANTQEWVKMINSLKTHYSGKLTYSANWGGPGFTDEKNHIGFWGNLDYIGLSAYFNLYANSTDYNSLRSAWELYRTRDIEPLYNQYKKPIIFTEVGYRSVTGAHNAPWDYALGGAYDPQEQVNDYEALFRYWDQFPYVVGVQLWHWESNPNAGGQGNTDYTPQNKPAEGVMSKWFGGNNPTNPPVTPPPVNPPGTTTPPTPPVTPGAWNSSAQNQTVKVGQAINIPVTVTNAGTANNVVVDVEIYKDGNAQVFQKYFANQNISSTQPGQYTIAWTPSQQGTYVVKLGVFSSDWSNNFYWNNNLATISVTNETTPPPPPPVNPPGTTTPPTNPGTTTPPTNPPGSQGFSVSTLPAEVISNTAAKLQGTVNMNGGKGTMWFEYSLDGKSWNNKAGVKGVSGNGNQNVQVIVNNLKPGTTYYYKFMAENYSGGFAKKVGQTMSFTTK